MIFFLLTKIKFDCQLKWFLASLLRKTQPSFGFLFKGKF